MAANRNRETPTGPVAPGAPGAPIVRGAPGAPGASNAPGAPSASNAPGAPSAHNAPGASSAPGSPGAPSIHHPQNPKHPPFHADEEHGRTHKREGPPRDKCIELALVYFSYFCIIIFFPFSLVVVLTVVAQYEKVVLIRHGKLLKHESYGPGLVLFLPCIDTVKHIDLRIIHYVVPPQEALTQDSLTVSVDAVLYYRVIDPVSTVLNVTNYVSSTQLLAATTLRNSLGAVKLTDLLVDRPAISNAVLAQMKKLTNDWGIKVFRVDIKDIRLPLQLQKAMAAEAESSRLANAKIIVAKAEIEATKSLQKASAILADNPMSMQLRYLQSLNLIAGEKSHTIVFPFSVGTLRSILK